MITARQIMIRTGATGRAARSKPTTSIGHWLRFYADE
jgi:hypothetical protein